MAQCEGVPFVSHADNTSVHIVQWGSSLRLTGIGRTANTVRRWEIGERWPDPRFRKHLVTIFAKPASELGLLTAEELSIRPDGDVLDELRRLSCLRPHPARR